MGDSKKRKKSSTSSNAAESTDSKRLKHTESKSSRTNSSKKKHSHGGSSKEGFTRSKDSAEKGDVLQWDARLASKVFHIFIHCNCLLTVNSNAVFQCDFDFRNYVLFRLVIVLEQSPFLLRIRGI